MNMCSSQLKNEPAQTSLLPETDSKLSHHRLFLRTTSIECDSGICSVAGTFNPENNRIENVQFFGCNQSKSRVFGVTQSSSFLDPFQQEFDNVDNRSTPVPLTGPIRLFFNTNNVPLHCSPAAVSTNTNGQTDNIGVLDHNSLGGGGAGGAFFISNEFQHDIIEDKMYTHLQGIIIGSNTIGCNTVSSTKPPALSTESFFATPIGQVLVGFVITEWMEKKPVTHESLAVGIQHMEPIFKSLTRREEKTKTQQQETTMDHPSPSQSSYVAEEACTTMHLNGGNQNQNQELSTDGNSILGTNSSPEQQQQQQQQQRIESLDSISPPPFASTQSTSSSFSFDSSFALSIKLVFMTVFLVITLWVGFYVFFRLARHFSMHNNKSVVDCFDRNEKSIL